MIKIAVLIVFLIYYFMGLFAYMKSLGTDKFYKREYSSVDLYGKRYEIEATRIYIAQSFFILWPPRVYSDSKEVRSKVKSLMDLGIFSKVESNTYDLAFNLENTLILNGTPLWLRIDHPENLYWFNSNELGDPLDFSEVFEYICCIKDCPESLKSSLVFHADYFI